MSLQDLADALPPAGGSDHELLLNSLWAQMYRALPDDVDFEAEDPLLGDTGIVAPGVIYNGLVYELRPDDTTSEHDGAVVLVLGGQYRYVTVGQGIDVNFVLSDTVTVPPDPEDEDEEDRPGLGDAYLVPAGAEGAWATKADKIAYWAGYHEWFYIDPTPGREVWVAGPPGGEDRKKHYDSVAGAWVYGFGANPLGSGIVLASTLSAGLVRVWRVQNLTTNTPPSEPSVGDNYVIGSSPTGGWTGQAFKLAACESPGAFTLYTPREGDQVRDLATNIVYEWNGSAWVSLAGAALARKRVFTADTTGTSGANGTGYNFSTSVAPTTGVEGTSDGVTLSHAARSAGNILEFEYEAIALAAADSSGVQWTIGLFRDSESSAIAWKLALDGIADTVYYALRARLLVTAGDALSHTYRIVVASSSTGDTTRPGLQQRFFGLTEYAP